MRTLRRAKRLQQSAERLHVRDILGKIFFFRCLEHFRDLAKTAVAHDEAERIETDPAFADVLMSIYARAACGFGIVQVNTGQSIETDDAIEIAKGFADGCFT